MASFEGTEDNDSIVGTLYGDNILGKGGNDTIDGGAEADTMIGGKGNDTYYVDNDKDVIIEFINEGVDEVISSISYTLDNNVENLTLAGSDDLNGTGNSFDNIITGNSGKNMLKGGSGNDTIDGGAGADIMMGEKGNDTYYVDNNKDVIIEFVNEGVDEVISSISYILDTNVENLTLAGSDNLNGTGNSLDNIIDGNSGNNYLNGGYGDDTLSGGLGNDTIDGGAGADIMAGGDGNDTYYVDDVYDKVTENFSEGIDKVISSISYSLDDNVENLTLTGSDDAYGIGNNLNNIIEGNSGNNLINGGLGSDTLSGGAGDDTLAGGTGNDVLDGGQGSDTFIFSSNWGQDSIITSTGYDVIKFDAASNISMNNLAIVRSGNNLELINVDTKDKITVENHFISADTSIKEIIFSDNITYLSLDQINQIAEHSIIGDNNNNILTGTNTNDFIWGLDGNDEISGSIGNDYMNGGSGNDTYKINHCSLCDTIFDASGIDKLVFGDDLIKTDFILKKEGNNLIIKSLDEIEQVTIDNWFLSNNYKVESFEFSNGNIVTSSQIDKMFTTDGQFKGWGDPHFIFNNARSFDFQGASGGSSGIYKLLENKDVSLIAEFASSISGNYATTMRAFYMTVETEAGTAEVQYKGSKYCTFKLNGVTVDNLSDFGITVSNEKTESGVVTTVAFNDRQFMFNSGSVITNIIKVDDTGILAQAPIAAAQAGYEDINQVMVNSLGICMAAPFAFLQGADSKKLAEAFVKMINLNSSYIASVKNTMGGASFNINDRSGINYNYNPDNDHTRTIYEKAELCARIAYAVINDKNCSNDMKIETFANWIKTSGEAMKLDIESNGGSLASRYQAGHGYSVSQWNEYLGTLAFAESADIDKDGIKDNAIDINNDGLADGFDLNADGILQDNEKVSINLGKMTDTLVEGDFNDTTYNIIKDTSRLIIRDNGGNDTVKFDRSISKDKVLFFMNNNDLIISYDNGDNNQVVIQNQQNKQRTVERFELADGSYITDTDIDEIIQKFALYQEEKGIQITGINDIRNNPDLMNIMENSWHPANSSDNAANEDLFVDTNEAKSDESFALNNDGTVNLYLTGSANINGTGNNYNNYIVGNSGNNILTGLNGDDILEGGDGNDTLDGGSGIDTLKGGIGDDTYIINDADKIIENSNEGTDTVISGISYTLGNNLENLSLIGSDNINATGNSFNNAITGNTGNNIIDGKSGADTMIGGKGNDTYYVNCTGDAITENTDEGIDTVYSSITYTLGDNLENLTLSGTSSTKGTGNSLDNVITGNTGNNIIDGKSGADTMIGGAGNDTYYVDNTGDIITENVNEGTDTVYSVISYTLGNDLENITLLGSDNINATGNSLNNIITGNTGNNILDGGIGADTLKGGNGDDTYYVDNTGDAITESSNQGLDTVISSISYTLGNNLENLSLLGSDNINATGNSLNNIITGNSGNNTLAGSSGNDIYTFGINSGLDTVYDTSGSLDKVHFNSDVSKTNIAMFVDSSKNLVIDYGTFKGTDEVIIQNQSKYTIERIELDNGQYLTNTDINKLIQSMTAFAKNHGVQMTSVNDVRSNHDLMNLVTAAWHS